MTEKEAAKILGQYDVSDIHFYTTDGEEIPFDKWSDAIEMAIKALEATSPCDLCTYNPPSRYGKPCSCCPAEPCKENENEQT